MDYSESSNVFIQYLFCRDKLVEIFNLALDNEEEGIVVKRSDALYRPNVRERSGCYKIKAEVRTSDLPKTK